MKLTTWAENFIVLPTGDRICLEDHQKRILDYVFAFDQGSSLPYTHIVYSAPKKSGKTTINAVVQAYFAYNVESPNEIIAASCKLDQTVSRSFRELKGFIRRNPLLQDETISVTREQITLKNGSILTAIPVNYAGEAGSNHGLCTFDELWGYTSESDRRLYEELTPVPTRRYSVTLVTSYAGFTNESELLEDLYRQVFNEDLTVKDGIERPLGDDFPAYAKGDLFVYWDHEPRMPWQTPEYYESQRQHLRANTFLRLHKNMWVSSESGLFDMERWDFCTDPGHTPPLPSKLIKLSVGVDASVKKDRSAVVSVYQEDGKLKLGPKRFWQPSPDDPMDLEETMESYLLDLHRNYTLTTVRYDPYQFHRSATTLQKKGLRMEEFPQTTGNLTVIGQNLFDLIEYGNLILYPCTVMRGEAVSAVGRETGRGLRIVKEKATQKIDQIVALAMAALLPRLPLEPLPPPCQGYLDLETERMNRERVPEDEHWIFDY